MKTIILKECFDVLPISDLDLPGSLTQAEANELEEFIRQNNLDMQFIQVSRRDFRFINYVGFIQLGTCSIEVLPKLDIAGDNDRCRQILLDMIAYSGYLDVSFSELAELKQLQGSLLDIYAHLFALKLARELQRGPYHRYEEREEKLTLLKGKVLLDRQAKIRANNQPGAWCSFNEFSQDNPLNQVLKAATVLLLKRVNKLATIQILRNCAACLAEVSAVNINNITWDKIIFDRMNKRFQPSYNLASAIIRSQTNLNSAGSYNSFGFVFRIEALFEQYIAQTVKELWGPMVSIQDNVQRLLRDERSNRRVFLLKPDIVIDTRREQLIIDTKWKFISADYYRHGVARDDLFQMYAYLTSYRRASAAILLYPYYSDFGQSSAQMLESWCLESQPEKKLRMYMVRCDSLNNTKTDLIRIIKTNLQSLAG